MSDQIINLNNENATDRNPYDQLSPEVDASNNPFEIDPDDSVDITTKYDDKTAQEIETKLAIADGSMAEKTMSIEEPNAPAV